MLTKTDDASYTLFSQQYSQTYHSTFGAVNESRHVFLHGSGVQDRLQRKQATRILEIGFGLGLNFLLCADCAATEGVPLQYVAVEQDPIDADTFTKLRYRECLDHPALSDDLLRTFQNAEQYNKPETSSEQQKNTLEADIGSYANLVLHIADASNAAVLKTARLRPMYDAIFLDAFSPDCNPECWTATFLANLALQLTPTGRLATYCVKGSVRRNLELAGLDVHKYPGPPGKREVLWAAKRAD